MSFFGAIRKSLLPKEATSPAQLPPTKEDEEVCSPPQPQFKEEEAAETLAHISASARKNRKSVHVRHSIHSRNMSRTSDAGNLMDDEIEQYLEEGQRDAVVAAEIGQRLLEENGILKSDLEELRQELAAVKSKSEEKISKLEKENMDLNEGKKKLASKLVGEAASPSKSQSENKSYKQLLKWQTINLGKKKKGVKYNTMTPVKDFGAAGSEVDWLWSELDRKEKEIESMQNELQQAASVGLELLKENNNLKEELDEKAEDIKRLNADRSENNSERDSQLIELRGVRATLQRKVKQLESKLKESEQENIMLWEDVQQYQEDLDETKKKLAAASGRDAAIYEEGEGDDDDREGKLEEMMRQMDAVMQSEREKMASVMEDVEYLQSEVDRLRDEEVTSNRTIATLHGDLKAAQERAAALQALVDPLQHDLEAAQGQIATLKSSNENLTAQIEEDHVVLEELRQRIRDLQAQLDEANVHFADTKAEYADKCRELEEKAHHRTTSSLANLEQLQLGSSVDSSSAKPAVDMTEIQEQLDEEREKRRNRDLEIESLKATISQLNDVISSNVEDQREAVAAAVQDTIAKNNKAEEALNKKIRELKNEVEALTLENKDLRAQLSRMEAALMEEKVRVEVKNEEIQRLIESNKRMANNRPMQTPHHERRISLGEAEPAVSTPKLFDTPSSAARMRASTVASDRDRAKVGKGRRGSSMGSVDSIVESEHDSIPATPSGQGRLWHRLHNMLHDKDELIRDLQLNAEKMATKYSKKIRGDSTNVVPAKSTPTVQSEMNHYLSYVNDVFKDEKELSRYIPVSPNNVAAKFKDGVLLCKFINFAIPLTIDERVVVRNSDMGIDDCRRNLVLALNSAKAIGCELGDVTEQSLLEGQEPAILLMLWQIILVHLTSYASFQKRPELGGIIPTKNNNGERPSAKQILLAWFNWHLSTEGCDRKVENFSVDVNDGVCLNKLLEKLTNEPNKLGDEESKKMSDVAERVVKLANLLGCGHFVSTKTILGGLSRLNFLFVAEVFQKCPQLLPLSTRRLDNDDGGADDQSSLLAWINHLGIKPMISNLVEDLRDGLVVLQAINIIKPSLVNWHRVCKSPSNRYKRLENCNYAVACGRDMGLQLVNISGDDMEKGNAKLVMSFIWQLRYYHMVSKLRAAQKDSDDKKEISDSDILKLANARVEEAGLPSRASSVRDSSIRSSEFLVDLIESICPKSTKRSLLAPGATDAECIDNARYAISVARMVGCSVFITPQHIVKLNKDMIIVLIGTLLSY